MCQTFYLSFSTYRLHVVFNQFIYVINIHLNEFLIRHLVFVIFKEKYSKQIQITKYKFNTIYY